MIEILLGLMAISFSVERIIEYVFDINILNAANKKITWIPMKKYSAIVIGMLIAFHSNLDFIHLILKQAEPSTVGLVLTGLLIAGGSNLISEIIKKVSSIKREANEKPRYTK